VSVRDASRRHGADDPTGTHRARRLESLSRLAAGVGHDVNNLLSVVLNYAAFIIEEADAAGAPARVIVGDAEQITEAAVRGSELTRQLLAFSGRERLRMSALDVNRLVGEAEPILRALVDGHVVLTTRLGGQLPMVEADPVQLERILVSLVVNAGEAMPAGGAITIETVAVDGGYVRLSVSDTGTGMPAGVADRAVEPFYTTKTGGSGLGLAAVYGLVTQAGGTIHLDSRPGAGTTVQILLPGQGRIDAPESGRDFHFDA
jgi:signal transduction histidine kinase